MVLKHAACRKLVAIRYVAGASVSRKTVGCRQEIFRARTECRSTGWISGAGTRETSWGRAPKCRG